MKIVKHSNSSRLGNDVMITTDVAIVESLGAYFVVQVSDIRGYAERKDITTTDLTTDFSKAVEDYYRLGGKQE